MRVTVITGSPHWNGTSALLAEKFIAGAQEVGHDIFRFDAAFEDVKPCIACNHCASHSTCVYQDAMNILNENLFCADAVTFVTPLHYFGFSAQVKAVISRFHANNAKLKQNKQAILMATSSKSDDWTMGGLKAVYEAMIRFLCWKDVGKLFATGCPSREVIEQSGFPDMAFALGKELR